MRGDLLRLRAERDRFQQRVRLRLHYQRRVTFATLVRRSARDVLFFRHRAHGSALRALRRPPRPRLRGWSGAAFE
jgi:hypothetical protein